jgi:hypothetical protein
MKIGATAWAVVLAWMIVWPADAQQEAAAPGSSWRDSLDNPYFKLTLNVRPRFEIANADASPNAANSERSEAYTVRTLLGLGTMPLYGFSGYVEGENSFTFDGNTYFNGVETATGQTPIADPTETDLNQGYLRYQNDKFLGLDLKAGRQRIKLDDDRFIGNVGWRQNEQTYDAALGITSLGVEGLSATYGYIWEVHRIFGDDGPATTRDFDSESDLVRVAYTGWKPLEAVVFAYLLDFDNSPGNSSNTFGFRLHGEVELGDDWSLRYAGSYAYQKEGANNPIDYDADYGAAEGSVRFAPVGSVALGYEHLGSGGGGARFVTPLATAHRFNGYADVFIDNGGPAGLEDLYVVVSPELPWELKGSAIYHRFWSDDGDLDLGYEIDAVLSRPITECLSALTKIAYYDGTKRGRPDIVRWWLQLEFAF